ncbi:apolipoprotein N-acyltransferase [Calycomorphotria hydatis]|uniref:Apolipoprotein N-acyltransferase n=1 Tax=Calycomorphotria hydatis TaxID=2528027 RepID=A0A517T4V3_9PLAN|nr:apolipoprotein N-acyltransferase [Calycomorphotria hydatis]QDT63399.1 Apolipoprotein N-acyltransferase [Calycomorphotria hydatis]
MSATELMTETKQEQSPSPQPQSSIKATPLDAEVRTIIDSARKPERKPARAVWLCGGIFGVLFWAAFFPLAFAPAAWLALVPLMMLIRLPEPTRWMYRALYLTALPALLLQLQWMRLGDPTMYPAWFALSIYLAFYVPLFVFASRIAVHKFHIPLVAAAPLVWVGCEWFQAHAFTGFSWYYLGHSQWRWTTLIQISDLVGGYGVSLIVATAAAAITMLLPKSLYQRLGFEKGTTDSAFLEITTRSKAWSVGWATTLLVAACTYGYFRIKSADFLPGPRVALIQGNYPTSMQGYSASPAERFQTYHQLTGLAVPHQPDMVVWPETVVPWPILEADPALTNAALKGIAPMVEPEAFRDRGMHDLFNDLATQAGSAIIAGVHTGDASAEQGFRQYNSAAFAQPELGLRGRYDKVHRVIFGEYIPLKDWVPGLQGLTPYRGSFGIDAGTGPKKFTHAGVSYTPLICFEDTVPHLAAKFVSDEQPDVLVNLSNDGWFNETSEQHQHLVSSLFRSVETRTPLVRAANTGVSAIIDGDGVIRSPEVMLVSQNGETTETDFWLRPGRPRKDIQAVLVGEVPLDSRDSLYVKWGDWFAITCGLFVGLCFIGKWFPFPKSSTTK